MVGQRAVDLDPAVDWPGVHDHRAVGGAREALGGKSITREKFARGIAQILRHSLALDAQHHDDVGTGNGLVDVARPGEIVGQ